MHSDKSIKLHRLLKQINQGEQDHQYYGSPKVRYGSYHEQTMNVWAWYDDVPYEHRTQRSWKAHRKTQYKLIK